MFYKRATRFFVSLILLIVCISLAHAGTRIIPSTDHIPLEDWTYDAMNSLASHGLVPGLAARVFQGDRLFNRMEMAEVVASIIKSMEGGNSEGPYEALVDKLVLEFRPELLSQDPSALETWSTMDTPVRPGRSLATGYGQAYAVDYSGGPNDQGGIYQVSGFANLARQKFAIGTLTNEDKTFSNGQEYKPLLDKAFVRGFDSNFVWSAGKEYQNWGPAYSGSLILSDNSPAFRQLRGSKEIDFGKFLGRIKITEFASSFEDSGRTLYLLGRRYERPISDQWHLGISETVKMNETPDPLLLVMPFYIYQHLFNKSDAEMNNLYGMDLLYQMRGGNQLYGELVIDDVTAPKILASQNFFERPNKTGYTLGFYAPKVLKGDRTSTLRAEYVFIRPGTYSATREDAPELDYTHKELIIGHPYGPNTKTLYLRGEQYLSDKFSIIAQYSNQQTVNSDISGSFRIRRTSLLLNYDFTPSISAGLMVSPYRVTGSNFSPTTESGTDYAIRASIGF